jgi:hypothetical protein
MEYVLNYCCPPARTKEQNKDLADAYSSSSLALMIHAVQSMAVKDDNLQYVQMLFIVSTVCWFRMV